MTRQCKKKKTAVFGEIMCHCNKCCVPGKNKTSHTAGRRGFYIPSAVFIFCYGNLIKGLYFDKTICVMDAEIQDDRTTEKKKLVITFLLATVNFIAGYGPSVVFKSLVYTGAITRNIVVNTILFFLFFCILCLNPVLYAFRSTNFQQGFKRVIFCCETQSETEVD